MSIIRHQTLLPLIYLVENPGLSCTYAYLVLIIVLDLFFLYLITLPMAFCFFGNKMSMSLPGDVWHIMQGNKIPRGDRRLHTFRASLDGNCHCVEIYWALSRFCFPLIYRESFNTPFTQVNGVKLGPSTCTTVESQGTDRQQRPMKRQLLRCQETQQQQKSRGHT